VTSSPAPRALKPFLGILLMVAVLQVILYAVGIQTIITDQFATKKDSNALTKVRSDHARPIGISFVAMGAMVSTWNLGGLLHLRRGRAPWRALLLLTLALEVAAVALWFPPARALNPGVESVFYASLGLLAATVGSVCWASRSGFYKKGARGLAWTTMAAFAGAQVAAWFWVDEYRRFGLLVAPLVGISAGIQLVLVWPGTLESLSARVRGRSKPAWSLHPSTKTTWSAQESPVVVLRGELRDGIKVERFDLLRILFHVDGQIKGIRTCEPGSPAVQGFSSEVRSTPFGDMLVEFRSDQTWASLYAERLAEGRDHLVQMLFRCTWSDGSVSTSTADLKFTASPG
jgi:hypothetical protein